MLPIISGQAWCFGFGDVPHLSFQLRIPFSFFGHWAGRLALIALVALFPPSTDAVPAHSSRVIQVTLLSLNRPGNVNDQNVLIRGARSLRRSKGVADVQIGRSLPSAAPAAGQPFDVAIVIIFKDRRAFDKFEQTERYDRLLNVALRPLVRRSVVYSFVGE